MAPFCVSDVLIHRLTPKHLSTAYVEELTEGVARAKKLLVFCECHLSSQIFLLFRSRAAR